MALGGFMMGRPGGSTPNKNLASSTREGGFASGGGGMSNGTTRNNTFGGQTARAEPGGGGGGLASPNVSRGGVLASERMVNRSAKGDRLQSVNIGAKGDYLGSALGSDAVNRSAKTGMSNLVSPKVSRGQTISNYLGKLPPAVNAARANVRLGPNAAMAMRDAGLSATISNKSAIDLNKGMSWDNALDRQLRQAQTQAKVEDSALNTSMGVRGIGVTKATPSVSKSSTGPVSRGVQPKSSTGPVPRGMAGVAKTYSSPKMKTGIQDYKSIVPGKVTMAAEMVPFAQKNPKLAKYMGGTPAKPINVSVEEAKKMAKSVVEVGAYVSGASPLAKGALDEKALKQLGTVKKGYGTTTVQAGKGLFSGTIDVSYPKSVATDKSFGTYTAGPLSSSGPVSRGVQPKASTGPVSRGVQPVSRMSTGPVPRGASPAPKSSTGPVSRGIQTSREAAKPTVQQVRVQSKENKAASVKSRIVKGGYVYNRVGDRLQNFTAESDVISRDKNRKRRNQK